MIAAVAGCFFTASPATAQTNWIDPLGGNYSLTNNWSPANVPNTSGETAQFNLPNMYNVSFFASDNVTVGTLNVLDGDVTFVAPGPATYNVVGDVNVFGGATFRVSLTGGGGDVLVDVASETDVGGIAGSSLLRINSGSRLETTTLFAGRNSNGDGTVVVDDATLDVLNSVILSSSGSTGTLTFQNGSTANDILGTTTLVSGSIAGSTGRLNVLSGSALNTGSIRVGSLSTSASAVQEATLTVDDTGSTLTQTGASTLTVGDATNPNVTSDVIVDNSGTFHTGTGLTLIQNSGHLDIRADGTFNANGDVTIDGGTLTRSIAGSLNLAAGKKLTASNDAQVTLTGAYFLNQGTEFEINSGADLFFSAIGVGFFGSDGTLVADGVGSTVTTLAGSTSGIGIDGATAEVTFRNQATGTLAEIRLSNTNDADPNTTGILNVESGAVVTMDDLSVTNVGGVGASGTVTVTGANSELTQNGASLLTLGHASSGTATINIENGGTFTTGTGTTTVNATGTINVGVVGVGNLIVANATLSPTNTGITVFNPGTLELDGGTLNSNEDLMMEGGNVHIVNGGTMSNKDAFVGFSIGSIGAELSVIGSTSVWNSSGTAIVGLFGSGTLNVSTGGSAMSSFGIMGEKQNSEGDAVVTGTNSSWQIANDLIVGNFGMGTLTISAGGELSSPRGFIAASTGSTGMTTVTGSNSLLSLTGDLYVGGNDLAPEGTGSLSAEDSGLVEVDGTLKIWDTGTVDLQGGRIVAGTIDHSNGGNFNFTAGTLTVDSFLGDLTQNGGALVIGSSPDITNVTGTYDQQAGGLEIELFAGGVSPVAGTDFDQLTADTANLGGSLDLVIDPNYTPTLGDLFPIISTTSGVSGTFGSVIGAYLGGGLGLDVLYNPNDVTVTVIDVLLGDFNVDSDVDGSDFLMWQSHPSVGSLADWEANYGMVAPLTAASAAVPEPNSLALLSLGGLLALRRVRRITAFTAWS